MRSDDPKTFEDPVLKDAVKKAYANERASAELRRRVAALASTAPDAAEGPAGPAPARVPGRSLLLGRRNPLYGLAAAALLLLAIGLAVSQYLGWFSGGQGNAADEGLPVAVIDAMTAAHEACAKLPDHHLLEIPRGDDMDAIRTAIREELGRPVLVAELGDGWVFKGAGVCKVGRYKAAHLLFARGQQRVSLFSLPAVSYRVKGDGNYELVASGHPIAGFAAPRGLYCLVGSDPTSALTTAELAQVRDRIRGRVTMFPEPPGGSGGVGAGSECLFHAIPPPPMPQS